MKKVIIIICLFLFIGINIGFCQNGKVDFNKPDKENATFSLLDRAGPSWVYELKAREATTAEIQIVDLENKILSSEKVSFKASYISKLNVASLSGKEFSIIILTGEREIYREKFIKN